MPKRLKCDSDHFCTNLLSRLTLNKRGKGLVLLHYMNIDTGEERGSLVVYKTSPSDKGLALNFCPVCGFPFHELYDKGCRVGYKSKLKSN